MFSIKTYKPCSFEHLRHMDVFLNKSRAFNQLFFSCKIKKIMPRLFKGKQLCSAGMLAAGFQESGQFECTIAVIYRLETRI